MDLTILIGIATALLVILVTLFFMQKKKSEKGLLFEILANITFIEYYFRW